MIKKLLKVANAGVLAMALSLAMTACGDKGPDDNGGSGSGNSELVASFPALVEVVKGQPCVITCNNNLTTTDVVYLEKEGKITTCPIVEAASDHFAFTLKDNFVEDTYKVSIKRGDRRVPMGNMKIVLISRKIVPEDGATIYGVVESAEGPIAGVVVSDGVNTAVTNAEGVYNLKSDKRYNYVFISVPSGYECKLNGVFPEHFHTLSMSPAVPENHSFTLTKVDQSNYRIIFMGDMHVANRSVNSDLQQFEQVAAEIGKYVKSNSKKTYGITLGDMTWDLYWYDRNYGLADYKTTINKMLSSSNMPIYHTIGNHDNDMNAIGNWNAKNPFKTNIAPPYYSFNIGGSHFVMLDNVDCSTYNGDGSRNHIEGQIYDPQWSWLAEDLKYVSKDTPVFVMMHVPVFSTTGVNKFGKNMKDCDKLLDAFDGYQLVHYVTGHTHRSYNIVPENEICNGKNIYEHNLSALCSDWWWSGKLTPGYLQATDGTPSGYGVWDIAGKDMKWIYKCAGKDENFQFRTYDLNNVVFTKDADVPKLTNAGMITKWNNITAAYNGKQVGKNEVLINAWQMNSRWKCTVKTEDGKELAVSTVSAYDPVQIFANATKRMNDASCTSEPIGTPQNRHHYYKVVAPDATTDLIITVTDEFGHTWTETMERPKAFRDAKREIDKSYKIDIK